MRPIKLRLNVDTGSVQPVAHLQQLAAGLGETNVPRTLCTVRRDRQARIAWRLRCFRRNEQQQDGTPASEENMAACRFLNALQA